MQANDMFIEQFNRIADILLPFAAGIAPGTGARTGDGFDATGFEQTPDAGAREWYGMFRVAAALLNGQDASLNEAQLLYLQRTFAGGSGSFQDFRLQGDHVFANKQIDIERQTLISMLAAYRVDQPPAAS